MSDTEEFDLDATYGDDPACRKFRYESVFTSIEGHRLDWALREGFYRGSLALISQIENSVQENFEGIAALFLFRHYLELSLKLAVNEGRWLTTKNENAMEIDFKRVRNIHPLETLWQQVRDSAQPKVDSAFWNEVDIGFLEACISEFHLFDPKGFAFRYPEEEPSGYAIDFAQLRFNMEHVHDVIERIISLLGVTYDLNS